MTDNEFRHPGGRTCAGVIAMWAALATLLAAIMRKAGAR